MSAVLEGEFNRKLKRALVARLPGCVVIKHSDVYTGGVPDFSVSNGAKTLWIEVKMKGNHCTPLQMNTLMRLMDAAHEIVADRNGKAVYLYEKMNTVSTYMSFEDCVETIALKMTGFGVAA